MKGTNVWLVVCLIGCLLISKALSDENMDRLMFCEAETFDNVFNIGRFIYFHRCGRFWVYNPDAYNGLGVVIDEYFLPLVISSVENNLNGRTTNFLSKSIHAFSLKHFNCPEDQNVSTPESCDRNPFSHKDYTAIITENGYYSFVDDFYHLEPFDSKEEFTDFKLKNYCSWKASESCTWFYPQMYTSTVQRYDSLLFDYQLKVMYAVVSYGNSHYIKLWDLSGYYENYEQFGGPPVQGQKPGWSEHHLQFTGTPVGMFHYRGQNYIVGRLLKTSKYADQVYHMMSNERTEVNELRTIDTAEGGDFATLRTFFGCDASDIKQTVLESGAGEDTPTTALIIIILLILLIACIVITVVYLMVWRTEASAGTKSDSDKSDSNQPKTNLSQTN